MEVTRSFPKDYKYNLANEIRDDVIELIISVYRANSCIDRRVEHLNQVLETLQVVELLIRLSLDMRIISNKQYADIIELTDSIGKQTSGWRKKSKTQGRV